MGASRKIRQRKHLLIAIVIGLIASFIVISVSGFSLFKTWELKTYDLRMVLTRGDRVKPENVTLFYVDEPSLRHMEEQGVNWPWPRELYSMAIDFCRKGGARAIVFDLFFSEDSVYGVEDDDAFAHAVGGDLPGYFVLFLSSEDRGMDDIREEIIVRKSYIPFAGTFPKSVSHANSLMSLPILPLVEAAAGFGNAQIPPDRDGVYRRIPLISVMGKNIIPSIPLKVVSDMLAFNKMEWPKKTLLKFGDKKIPLDNNGMMMINYYGGVDTFSVYSLAEILVADAEIKNGKKPSINPDVVKDKVVVIGVAAPGLYDMKASPFSHVYPGPEVHATIIENLLSGDFIKPLSRASGIFLIIICGLLASLGLALITSSWGMGIWFVSLILVMIGSSFLAFFRGVWIPLVFPVSAILASSFAMVAFRFLTEGRKKREIKRAFGQYLSPEIVKDIANDPESLKLGGEEREITILFSDIADFTSISEKTLPDELVGSLNEYFSMITHIIHEYGGTLDKYIGDAIMAFWGAPLRVQNHAVPAVIAAIDIQKALAVGSDFVTRIGIHTSKAIVGNIGSDIRFNYTAIGDAVNLASRLEGLNKKFGTRVIISGFTFDKASDAVEARRIGRVRVKGREEPISIFEPLGAKGDYGELGQESFKLFDDALVLFENGEFKEAGDIFGRLVSSGNDPVSKYYKDICDSYINNPPDKFDGVITFKTK